MKNSLNGRLCNFENEAYSHTSPPLRPNCCRLGRSRCRLGRSRCRLGRSRCRLGRSRCRLGRSRCRLGRSRCRLGRVCRIAAAPAAASAASAESLPLPLPPRPRLPNRCRFDRRAECMDKNVFNTCAASTNAV